MRKSLITLLLLFVISGPSPCVAKESLPLKVIAPDLVIESAEQGEFLDDPADPRRFKTGDIVGKKCGLFGWRMKVKTTRKLILVQEKGSGKGQGNALPVRKTPKHGYLFSAADIVQGVPRGKYSSTVFVENVPVKTFTRTVK
jgi:hypothetical protein